MTLTIKPIDEIHYTEVKSFVDFCNSTKDFAITSEENTGTFHCPIANIEVKVENGFCQASRSTCKEHC